MNIRLLPIQKRI